MMNILINVLLKKGFRRTKNMYDYTKKKNKRSVSKDALKLKKKGGQSLKVKQYPVFYFISFFFM